MNNKEIQEQRMKGYFMQATKELLKGEGLKSINVRSIAAQAGFKQLGVSNQAIEGFLLGAKNLEIYAPAHIGDILTISLEKYARFGDFGIFKGKVFRGQDLLAQGEVKVWENKKKL